MGTSSLVSGFQFYDYTIHAFKCDCKSKPPLPSSQQENSLWEFNLEITQPLYHKRGKIYICGLSLQGHTKTQEPLRPSQIIINFDSKISGIFRVEKKFSKELEEKLVKIQAPSLLLPYLRSTITSYLANAGLGHIILPLINIHKMAKDSLQNIDILVQD